MYGMDYGITTDNLSAGVAYRLSGPNGDVFLTAEGDMLDRETVEAEGLLVEDYEP